MSSGTSVPLTMERRGPVAVAFLDRPDQLNALNSAVIEALDALLDALECDPDVAAIVIAGRGRAFCAGADIDELRALEGRRGFAAFVQRITDTYARLQALSIPSIAAVHGLAFGGGFELALTCDLRVADRDARLGVPEIKLGLLPAAGGTARLTRMLPPAVAKQLLLTGEPIGALEAHRLGLVNTISEPGGALESAVALAERLSSLSASALAAAKRLVDDGASMPLTAAVTLERQTVSMLYATPDSEEGMAAFLEKRPARFR
jgi:enoyl-CoA hydratase